MRVLALAGYDSFLNTARLIAPYFEKQGVEVEYAIVKARKAKQITPQQVTELGLNDILGEIDLIDFCQSGAISRFDIVLASLEGLSTRRLFQFLPPYGQGRPIVISVYPGLVLRYLYDGLSTRAPADLLWLNCRRDMREYRRMCEGFGIDHSNARLFGNGSVLEKIKRNPKAVDSGPIVFFEQAVIPRHYDERRFLVAQLFELANQHPNKQILIKARTLGSRSTLHKTWYPIDRLFSEVSSNLCRPVPANISLTEQETRKLLSEAFLCLTVSSTVAVEALYADIPTVIINDFGAHDDYGLQYFYGSGILKNFDQIDLQKLPVPDKEWLDEHTCNPTNTINMLVDEAINAAQNRMKTKDPQNMHAMHSKAFLNYLQGVRSLQSIAAREFQRKKKGLENILMRLRG